MDRRKLSAFFQIESDWQHTIHCTGEVRPSIAYALIATLDF